MGANIIIPKNGGGASIWEGLLGDKTFDILSKDIYGVLELRDYVFANKNITHAELSPMIQTIGENAFKNCSQLIDVTIPNSVTHIKVDAFSGCSQLSTIYFRGVQEEWDDIVKDNGWDGGRYINIVCMQPSDLSETDGVVQSVTVPANGIIVIPPTVNGDTITSIAYQAFGSGNNVKEVILPRTITSLPYSLFRVHGVHKPTITSAVLPEGITSLNSTFSGCRNLETVTIPSTLVSAGYQSFDYCQSLRAVYIADLAAWCNISFESSVGSNPLEFAHHLYLNGVELKDLIIPEGVTHIGEEAFIGLTSIETLILPSTLEALPSMLSPVEGLAGSFRGCSNLSSITMNGTSEQYYVDNNCVIGRDPEIGQTGNILNAVMMGCKNSIIPQSPEIISIARNAFCGDRGEFSLNIPSNITWIGDYAFNGCVGLHHISFPDTAITIGDYAFAGCTGLEYIYVPSNVTLQEARAFMDCSSLREISGNIENTAWIGNVCHSSDFTIRVTEGGAVGVGQYYGVPVKELYWPKDITYIGSTAFNANTTLTALHYDGTISEWEAIPKDTNWNGSEYLKTIHCTDGDIEL